MLATVGLCESTVARAASPYLVEDRTLAIAGARFFWPTGSDYNGDGVDDLIGRTGPAGSLPPTMLLIDGKTGAKLRQYTPPTGYFYDTWTFTRATTLPDVDGDGLREFLFATPGDAWVIHSSTAAGPLDPGRVAYTLANLPFGLHVANAGPRTVLASGDKSQLTFIDSATGAVTARLSNNQSYGFAIGSLGQSMVNLGDLNGDGVADFGSSGGNVATGDGDSGVVYLIDGRVTTSGTQYVPIPAHPLMGQLSGIQGIGAGDAGLWNNTSVNLGDPHPGNGDLTESLIVSGGPWGTYEAGGLVAHVATAVTRGDLRIQRVATYVPTKKEQFGAELADVGDVNNDGVHDLASFSANHSDAQGNLLGEILIISGAGLLDGFDLDSDVLQRIDGLRDAFFYGSFQNLGDADHDGHLELGITVLYNGNGGKFGYAQRVYEVVPEPTTLAAGALGWALMTVRRRRA